MARIHAHRKGQSHSTRPTSKRTPSWVTYSPEEVSNLVVKMAEAGEGPSLMGIKLRDEYGVPLAKPLLGKSILQVLKEEGKLPETPEDLKNLLTRAKRLMEHLKEHPGDQKNVHSLELLEAKVHRLSRYYRRMGRIPQSWKYKASVAQLA